MTAWLIVIAMLLPANGATVRWEAERVIAHFSSHQACMAWAKKRAAALREQLPKGGSLATTCDPVNGGLT